MRNQNSKSALFLMELIIAILFFAISSAVCVQLFVKAHLMSRDTTDLNHAVACAESASACLRAKNGALDAVAPLLPGAESDGGALIVWYDADWQPTSDDAAVYEMRLETGADETVQVTVSRAGGGSALYALPVTCHQPLRAG